MQKDFICNEDSFAKGVFIMGKIIITEKDDERRVKLLSPKIDVVFHALFREEHKELLEVWISDVLNEKVQVVTTDKNRYVDTIDARDKLGIMDLRAELSRRNAM